MPAQAPAFGPGARFLFVLAAFAIVVTGMKQASGFIAPLLVAVFLAVMCIPQMRKLQARGCPEGLSIVVVVTAATVGLLVVSAMVGRSIQQFQDALPTYTARLEGLMRDGTEWLQGKGVDISADEMLGQFDSSILMQVGADAASGVLSALSNVLLAILTVIFILLEANSFPKKLRESVADPDASLRNVRAATDSVQNYLFIKAWISLGTGMLAGLLCLATGVDFAVLWALIAFLFNFVPNIGSVIAAVPAVLLGLLQHGPLIAGIVAAGYVGINMVVGNVLEPRVMGRRLGLSTLVVFLSLVFWGWILGPTGMLLSVPLTVIAKLIFEHVDDLRWIANILGPAE